MQKLNAKKKLSNIVRNLYKSRYYKTSGKLFIKTLTNGLKKEKKSDKIFETIFTHHTANLYLSSFLLLSIPQAILPTALSLEGLYAAHSLYTSLKCEPDKLEILEDAINNPKIDYADCVKISNLDITIESEEKKELFKKFIKNARYFFKKDMLKLNKIKDPKLINFMLSSPKLEHTQEIINIQNSEEFKNMDEGFNKDLLCQSLAVQPYAIKLKEFKDINCKKENEQFLMAAAKQGWYITHLEHLEKDLEKFSYLKKHFTRLLERGFDYFSIVSLFNDEIKTLSKEGQKITDILLKKASKDSLVESLNAIVNLDKTDSEGIIKKISQLGKKKIIKAFNRLAPLIQLYEHPAQEIEEYLQKQEDFSDTKKFNSFLEEKINAYFGLEKISDDITFAEKTYLLRGYCQNRQEDFSKDFIRAVLAGEDTFDFKGRNKLLTKTESKEWVKGYYKEKEDSANVQIDFPQMIKDNYEEALDHLKNAGFKFKKQNDMMATASSLIPQLEKSTEDILIKDALEHLKLMLKLTKQNKKIKGSSLIYKTGNLKDMAFIGEKPNQTCLGLGRSNSRYTVGMAHNYHILPFIISANTEFNEVPLERSILRLVGDYILIDDIYGQKLDFVDHVNEFAKQVGKDVIISKKMSEKLTEKDKNLFSKAVDLKYDIEGPQYSDTFRTISDQTVKTIEGKYPIIKN